MEGSYIDVKLGIQVSISRSVIMVQIKMSDEYVRGNYIAKVAMCEKGLGMSVCSSRLFSRET